MKRDQIDFLLQLAYLEGTITTHGLYEQAVARRRVLAPSHPAAKGALLKRLEAAQAAHQKKTAMLLTVGEFLRKTRDRQALQPQEIFNRIGVSSNIYKMLERDRISPMKISVESWTKFQRLFRIPLATLQEMLHCTYRLVYFRRSFQTTLARYDSRKNKEVKALTVEHAAEELYARATLALPREEQAKLDSLWNAIKKTVGDSGLPK